MRVCIPSLVLASSALLSAQAAPPARVLERRGDAARRGVGETRWTVAAAARDLQLGDLLRTGARGPNALVLRLAGGAQVTLGPGCQLELVGPHELRVERGELELRPAPAEGGAAQPLLLRGPQGGELRPEAPTWVRAGADGLETLAGVPPWLAAYRADRPERGLGSLLAQVDGRSVPLGLGFHKVTVDIRDQIARTVVEESFVNHTPNELEGVFYFPLPQDASISGFAMWIGDELVPGEIVERQRARAIFETILRERRDPASLEWAGGSLFKARVFPIRSEKRIRLTYTQVLPREGDTLIYRYPLEGELLRRHPVREMQLTVHAASSRPFVEVRSPSHPCRIRSSEGAASVEFSAEEYVPSADFELRLRQAPEPEPLRALAHRRGDDGYLMLLLEAPPAPAAARVAPLHLVVIADSSGSTAGAARRAQLRCLEALLGALGPEDRFELLTCDVETRAAFPEAVPALPEQREQALAFLEAREPLGWTDLVGALRAAAERAGPGTQVVYLGDGAHTAEDPDPVACAQRIRRELGDAPGSFHVLVPGNRSEGAVVQAIASLGGGSLRRIAAEDPAATAYALVDELSRPAVRDLRLRFEGLEVAALHPARLPNLASGTQQLVLARYDARGGARQARVVLEGTRGGEAVAYPAQLSLPAADAGNAFIPRLWARRHLDHLLGQGRSPQLRAQVVALSGAFQIMTPFTSFLVLESEADRQRFGVPRTMRLRDGEDFFAEGRAGAQAALRREQVLAARGWRRRLRQRIRRSLADMGRGMMEELGGPRFRGGAVLSFGDDDTDIEGDAEEELPEGLDDDEGPAEEDEPAGDGEDAREEAFDEEGEDEDGSADHHGEAPLPELGLVPEEAEGEGHGHAHDHGGPGGVLSFDEDGEFEDGYYPDPFPHIEDEAGGVAHGGHGDAPWPTELASLLAGLDRRRAVAELEGALSLEVAAVPHDLDGNPLPGTTARWLVGPAGWVHLSEHAAGEAFRLAWVWQGRRGVVDATWLLGRERAARAEEPAGWPTPFRFWFGDALDAWRGGPHQLRSGEPGQLLVHLENPHAGHPDLSLRVERARGVLLEAAFSLEGVSGERLRYEELQQVAGAWWPGRIVEETADGRVITVRTVRVQYLTAEAAAEAAAQLRAPCARAGILTEPLPDEAEARHRLGREAADLAASWVLLRREAKRERWTQAAPHLAAIARLLAERPGLELLRLHYLEASRQRVAGRELAQALARRLVDQPRPAEHAAALDLRRWGELRPPAERLALLDLLRPVSARRDPRHRALWTWEGERLQTLRQLGHRARVLSESERLAREYPRELAAHTGLATELVARRRLDAAIAHLRRAEEKHGPWRLEQRRRLREGLGQALFAARQLEAFLREVAAWEDAAPALVSDLLLHARLEALLLLERDGDYWALLEGWLRLRTGSLAPEEQRRLRVGVEQLLGNVPGAGQHRLGGLEPRAAELLARTARWCLVRLDPQRVAWQILEHHRFRASEAGQRLRAQLLARLAAELETLAPAELELILRRAGPVEDPDLRARLFARWEAASPAEREGFPSLWGCGTRAQHLAVWRQRLDAPQPRLRREAAEALAASLLDAPWSREAEAEVLRAFPRLRPEPEVPQEDRAFLLEEAAVTLYSWVDWASEGRIEAQLAADPPRGPRATQRVRARARRAARGALREQLVRLEELLPAEGELRAWATLERLWLQVKLGASLEAAHGDALALLQTWRRPTHQRQERARRRVLLARAATTLLHLLARDGAAAREQWVPRLRGFIDAALAADAGLLDWKRLRFLRLMSAGPEAELQATIAAWSTADASDAPRWGRIRGYLLAEADALAEACALFQELGARDALRHGDWRSLATWHEALGQPELAAAARARSWDALGVDALDGRLARELDRLHEADVPPEPDPEAALWVRSILRRAREPGTHLWGVAELYALTRDHRLLEGVPGAVLGHTPAEAYDLLLSLEELGELLQEEATIDAMLATAEALRAQAAGAPDRRALRLFEFGLCLRASRQEEAGDAYAARALTALQASFPDAAAPGERVLLAGLLAAQRLERPELAAERRRQLRALWDAAEPGSAAHEEIAHELAGVLWDEGRRDAALRVHEQLVAAWRGGAAGIPAEGLSALYALLERLGQLERWEAAAELLDAELAAARGPLRGSLQLRRFHLVEEALRAGVSLGGEGGRQLFLRSADELLASLGEQRPVFDARERAERFASLLELACQRPWDLADALTGYAFDRFPRLVRHVPEAWVQTLVSALAEALRARVSPRAALLFLLERGEGESRALTWRGHGFWSRHAGRLGILRAAAEPLDPELEERLLALTLAELRRCLRADETVPALCRADHPQRVPFWRARAGDFARVARELGAAEDASGSLVMRVGQYLFRSLDARAASLELLQAAHARGLFDREQRSRLANLLQAGGLWAESLPLLEEFVAAEPERLQPHRRLAEALAHLGRDARLDALLAGCLERFGPAAQGSAYASRQLADLHRAVERFQGVADWTETALRLAREDPAEADILCDLYQELAWARVALGETQPAIDAACAALLHSAGYERDEAVNCLRDVVAGAEDLAPTIARLDAETRETGLENPLLRRVLGEALHARGEDEAAIAQVQRALRIQPRDEELHRLLIDCHDAREDAVAAARQLLALVRLRSHDPELLRELGRRYVEAGADEAAERAWTEMVEALPLEARSHATLAELRLDQDRLEDAVVHWSQVARLRADEPTGLLGLGRTLLLLERWDELAEVVQRLEATDWPPRFAHELSYELEELQDALDEQAEADDEE